MMKYLLTLILLLLMLNFVKYWILQFIYQNMMFLLLFMFMINFSLNNNNFWFKLYYNLGCDFYSLGLILLSMWIFSLMIMSSNNNFLNENNYYYLNILSILLLFLILCFMSMNIILFYLFFESSLIPVFLLIMGWGFQVDRIQAGFYMMLYTLLGSLPLFYMIMMIYKMNNTMMFFMIKQNFMFCNIYCYMLFMAAFLIKVPMYLVHLWLPKAHVEAPLVGSMILAGVMLKLGGYGLMRFMMLMINFCVKFNKFIIIISLMGGVYSSLICMCMLDMKMLVAYSSVVHMSLFISGLLTMYKWSYLGGIFMMISHGLCSSGLFYLVNVVYERLNSRNLLIVKGLINFWPNLGLMWFLLCSSNMSFPFSLNLFSEIILLSSLIMWSKLLLFKLMMILFFSSIYTLYLYSFSQHGESSKLIYMMKSIYMMEYLILLLHWLPLNILFMYMYIYI